MSTLYRYEVRTEADTELFADGEKDFPLEFENYDPEFRTVDGALWRGGGQTEQELADEVRQQVAKWFHTHGVLKPEFELRLLDAENLPWESYLYSQGADDAT